MTSTKILKSGVTTFKSWEESFHFAISTNDEGKVDILLEGKKSRKQWCTGYMAMDEYVTSRNNIANIGVKDYTELFLKILKYSDDDSSDDDSSYCSDDSDDNDDDLFWGKAVRTLLTLENDTLQLDLSIKFTVVGGSWTMDYKFQLEPVSLGRIRALEAKLRRFEADTNKRPAEAAEESDGEMVDVDSDLMR